MAALTTDQDVQQAVGELAAGTGGTTSVQQVNPVLQNVQASEICNFAKQIETHNGDKIRSTITQHCWTDKPVPKPVIPLPDVLPNYNETILIRQECIGDEVVKHNIKGMEYDCD